MPAGKFIVFEGGEGSGKSSHVKLSAEYLRERGITVMITHEPGGTPLGETIRQLILRTGPAKPVPLAEFFLFLADRAQHVETFIQPLLRAGTTVVCDRFSASTLAYQIGGRGLQPADFIATVEAYSRAQLNPDIVLYLEVDPTLGLERKRIAQMKQYNRFEKEDIKFHKAIAHYFATLKTQPTWQTINANQSLPLVQEKINRILDQLFV